MTHAPLPYTANGESLLDARGNVIATFLDYRDAEACADTLARIDELEATLEKRDDEIARLEENAVDAKAMRKNTFDAVDDALRFVKMLREQLADDFATLDATIGELSELKEKLGA